MSEKCLKCGIGNKDRYIEKWSCGTFVDENEKWYIGGACAIFQERNLYAAALAVDLGEWVNKGTYDFFVYLDNDGWYGDREYIDCNDFLPLAIAIALWQSEGGE